jgi:nitrogen regulatory protein PII
VLNDRNGRGVTVPDVRGFGRLGGHVTSRGAAQNVEDRPEMCREGVVCGEAPLPRLFWAGSSTRLGADKIGDDRVWVTDVARVVGCRIGAVGRPGGSLILG